MPVVSVDEIKGWLGSGLDNTTEEDDNLMELEKRIVQHVEMLTGRRFSEPTELEEIHDGNGKSRLWLRNFPVDNAITSVEDRIDIGDAWAVVATTDYVVNGRRVFRTNGEIWTEGLQNYRVVYEAGYSSADMPQDVKHAVMEIMESTWHNRLTATPALIVDQTIDIPRTAGVILTKWKVVSGSGAVSRVL